MALSHTDPGYAAALYERVVSREPLPTCSTQRRHRLQLAGAAGRPIARQALARAAAPSALHHVVTWPQVVVTLTPGAGAAPRAAPAPAPHAAPAAKSRSGLGCAPCAKLLCGGWRGLCKGLRWLWG